MLIVAIAWLYVVLMMALAEALSPQGSVLGAVLTVVGYGVLPLALLLYILNTPARKRALRRREAAEHGASACDGDRGGEPPGEAVAAKREEP